MNQDSFRRQRKKERKKELNELRFIQTEKKVTKKE